MSRQPRDPLPPPRPRRPLPVGPAIVPGDPDQPQPVGALEQPDDAGTDDHDGDVADDVRDDVVGAAADEAVLDDGPAVAEGGQARRS